MAVDRNLFLHDLAIVAIMKCEAPYIKEWLDYHLLAGVDHFYIYDNDSPDNQAEIVAPYVKAGLVDYIPAPGKVMQMFTHFNTVKHFKFFSRYMAIIDGDEFIYPKVDRGGKIVDVVDDILLRFPEASGLAANLYTFGSNGQETADYSRGVLERFTRRASGTDKHVSTIFNPRMVNYFPNPHHPIYFDGAYSINENGGIVIGPFNEPGSAEKIAMNHYHTKSREEYAKKVQRGNADHVDNHYSMEGFKTLDCNDEFDDGILKYREARAKVFELPDKTYADARLLTALAVNLAPALLPNTPQDFYAGKMETFLTCRAVSAYLKTKLTDAAPAELYEEAALKAILKALSSGASMADARLLISELPNLLTLPYPVVGELRGTCLNILQQMLDVMRLNNRWLDFAELDYVQRLLQTWK